MPTTRIRSSRELAGAYNAMMTLATDQLIGMVMRWDEDDDLIWTIWAENGARNPANPPNDERRVIQRPDQRTPVNQNYAHAEEVMIASWAYFKREAGSRPRQRRPRIVEIFLSKSPCASKGSSRLTVVSPSSTTTYPDNCAYKLRKLIIDKDSVNEWHIYYASLAGTKVTGPSRHDRAATTATQITTLEQNKPSGWRKEVQRLRGVMGNLVDQTRDPVAVTSGANGKISGTTLANFAALLSNDPRRAQATRDKAESTAEALLAVGVLNAMPKVTCEPLNAMPAPDLGPTSHHEMDPGEFFGLGPME